MVRTAVLILIVGCFLVWATKHFTVAYNERLEQGIQRIDGEILALQDSIPLKSAEMKEHARIAKLSMTRPITPEHVRGEALRVRIEGWDRCELWIYNKTQEIGALEKIKKEAQDSRIQLPF